MAVVGDRPLLVVHDTNEGHLVYDLLLLLLLVDGNDNGEEVACCFPRPVARFPSQWCLSFAVSGGSIVGAEYDWNDTYFHDTVMKVGGYDFWERQASPRLRDSEGRLLRWWPMFRSYEALRTLGGSHLDKPAMLPLPDGTVVRMDTILFDGIYTFETLHGGGGGRGWHATPLPNPPVGRLSEAEITFVSAYLAIGTRVWISVSHMGNNKGTFSLSLDERTWRKEGTWMLPFQGRALYVPELGAVVGLTTGTRQLLCACDVNDDGTLLPVLRMWPDTFPRPCEEEECSPSKPRDMPSLAYLGKGRICICRPMSTMEPSEFGPAITYNGASLLVVELSRSNNGDLQLVRRGKMSYMCPPQGRESPYIGFIQPAVRAAT